MPAPKSQRPFTRFVRRLQFLSDPARLSFHCPLWFCRCSEWTAQQKKVLQQGSGLFTAIIISIAMAFVPASYAVFLVKEREVKAKHLQLISGVGLFSFWVANFLWDILQFSLVAAGGVGIVYAYGNPTFASGTNLLVLISAFALYGAAVIPFTYALSFLFDSHSTAQNTMLMLYLLGGLVMSIASFVLGLFPTTQALNSDILRYAFRLSPNFCLSDCVFQMSLLGLMPAKQAPSPWALAVVGWNLVFLAAEAGVFFLLTVLFEWLGTRADMLASCLRKPVAGPMAQMLDALDGPEDADVAAERRRIENGGAQHELIRLEGVNKVYPNGKKAVHDLWFSIARNACFGFLGVNGAGKSSTLKILTVRSHPRSSCFLFFFREW